MSLKIKLKKSLAGRLKNQIATAKSLKLRKINNETIQPDNEATHGKIKIIEHMVEVSEV